MSNIKRSEDTNHHIAVLVLSVVVWIVSIALTTISMEIGVAVWIVSLVILGIGVLMYMDHKKRQQKMEREALIRFGADKMDGMSGKEFEYLIMCVFQKLEYKVERTPTTGDMGADLIMKNNKHSVAVQAKRHSKNIGNRAVQEINSGRNHYKTQEAWVITNSYFTRGAYKQAQSDNVRLVDRDAFRKYIFDANRRII